MPQTSKLISAIEVEESAIHPHLLATLIVGAIMTMVGVFGLLGSIYGYLTSGGKFAVFIGLFLLVIIQVTLLASRPMPYEIENYKRRKKK